MIVRELASPEEFHRYVEFASEVYREVPAWVPPDPHHLVAQLRGEALGGGHTRIQPFWVEDGGRIVATCTAVVDDLFNTHWREWTGHVLFFEALSGQEAAARAVLDAACAWLTARGCRAARVGFLYGWQLPLTIDAYDERPTVFHSLNPPYYHRYLKDAGFVTENGQAEYLIEFTPQLAARYEQMMDRVRDDGVVMRSWRFDDAEREGERFSRIYNATFGTHWGAPQFTVDDCQGLIAGMSELRADDLTVFADRNGETVGAVFALPDLNQALHRLRSASGADDATVAAAFAAIDHGVLLSISVLDSARGTGLNLAMAARVYLAMIARGYRSASYTTVLDTNWRSRRTAEKLGGRIRRNFVVYHRALG